MIKSVTSFLLISLSLTSFAFAEDTFVRPRHSVEELKAFDQQTDWSKELMTSIVIAAPIEEVWKYVSDSANAKNWSVYFSHIRPLPAGVPDGEPGSLRRCFRNPDEKGRMWDEMVVEVVPQKRRLIHSYEFRGYWPEAQIRGAGTLVVQGYEAIDSTRTRLSFQTALIPGLTAVQRTELKLAMPDVRKIFRRNLENIREAIEKKDAYRRIYPWTGGHVQNRFRSP